MKQISIEVENEPRRLSAILGLLAERHVEIRALTVGHTLKDVETSLVKMIVNRLDAALAAFGEKGIEVHVEDVVVTPVEDHAGGLHAILRVLAEAELNIEHVYTFVSRVEGKALSVFTFDDPKRGRETLRAAGVRLVSGQGTDDLEELDISDYWDHDVTW